MEGFDRLHPHVDQRAARRCRRSTSRSIDGDHNWYTVYNELQAARARCAPRRRRAAAGPDHARRRLAVRPPRPLLRARADPRGVPPAVRAAGHAARTRASCCRAGGLNPTHVQRARRRRPAQRRDDRARRLHRRVRPAAAPRRAPDLLRARDRRRGGAARARSPSSRPRSTGSRAPRASDELLELAENDPPRGDALPAQRLLRQRSDRLDRGRGRYLDLSRRALLDEHYLENELRLEYLARLRRAAATRPTPTQLRDPVAPRCRTRTSALAGARRRRRAPTTRPRHGSYLPYTDDGPRPARPPRSAASTSIRDERRRRRPRRVRHRPRRWRDLHARLPRRPRAARPRRSGSPTASARRPSRRRRRRRADGVADLRPTSTWCATASHRFDLLDDRVRFLQGRLADTLADAPIEQVALLRIGAGHRRRRSRAVLDALLRPSSRRRLRDRRRRRRSPTRAPRSTTFRARRGHRRRRSSASTASARRVAQDRRADARRLGGRRPSGRAMRRRAARAAGADATRSTSRSSSSSTTCGARRRARCTRSRARTSRASTTSTTRSSSSRTARTPDQRLGEEFVASFGPEFRYVDLGDGRDAVAGRTRSTAASRAAAGDDRRAHDRRRARAHAGRAALRHGRPARPTSRRSSRPSSGTSGPGQQPDAMHDGYDQAYEDELFEQIEWPLDGYRLFEIGHFIGDRDWFDGVWESNCMFVPRTLLEQVGGFDEQLLDARRRLRQPRALRAARRRARRHVVTILGEGSFHQVHGGTTTNRPTADERRTTIVVLRRALRASSAAGSSAGPGKTLHYVGTDVRRRRSGRARGA